MTGNKKRAVLAGFLIFLGFMAVCTVIAKGIYKNALPRVQTGTAEKKSLHYEIEGNGTVMPGEIYGVYVPQGLRVETVYARVGARVEEEEVLFLVDREDLEEQIRALKDQKSYLSAQISDLDREADAQGKEKKKLEERLLEDHDALAAELDLQVDNAKIAMESAKLRMEIAEENVSDDVSGSDLQYELLKKEYEAAENAVEEARLHRQNALTEWERNLTDSREEAAAQTAAKVRLSGELSQCGRTLEKLEEILKLECEIRAPQEGTVLDCAAEAGSRTGDGACLLYARAGDGVEVTVSAQDGALLSIGDTVELSCRSALGDRRSFDGRIRYRENREGSSVLYLEADVSGLPSGQAVQMSFRFDSETYDLVIPQRALYQTDSGSFVYVLEQTEGILGMEYRPRREYVTVAEQNGEYAAIRSFAIDALTPIIISSNKELSEDTAVRPVSE